jgi:histidine ammonia-lyase
MLKFQMKIYQNYKKIWLNHILVVPVEKYQLIVKLMLLLKIQSLSYGHSGIQLQTVERLIAFIIMIFSCNL